MEKFTIAKYPSASRRFSHEYGAIRALPLETMRMFLDSLRLSAQAVRTIPSCFTPKERGVYSFFGSKNCQLMILNGFQLSSEVISESFFLAKSGSPVVSSYHLRSRTDSRRAPPLRSTSWTQRLTRSYAESRVCLPVSIVFHVSSTPENEPGCEGIRFLRRRLLA